MLLQGYLELRLQETLLQCNIRISLSQGLTNLRSIQRAELSKLAAQYGLSKMRDISLFVANLFASSLNRANYKSIALQNEVTLEQIGLLRI